MNRFYAATKKRPHRHDVVPLARREGIAGIVPPHDMLALSAPSLDDPARSSA